MGKADCRKLRSALLGYSQAIKSVESRKAYLNRLSDIYSEVVDRDKEISFLRSALATEISLKRGLIKSLRELEYKWYITLAENERLKNKPLITNPMVDHTDTVPPPWKVPSAWDDMPGFGL